MSKNSSLEDLKKWSTAYNRTIGRSEHVFALAPEKAALLVVDMQQFVCDPGDSRNLQALTPVVKTINELAAACRSNDVPVIWIRHNFNTTSDGNDAGLYPRFHKQPLSPGMFDQGAETVLSPRMHHDPAKDHVVFKNRYSGFAEETSQLHGLLQRLAIGQLWVTGVATNVCVESTARDAMQRDYEVIMIENAMSAPFELLHQVILINFKMFFGDVQHSDAIFEALG